MGRMVFKQPNGKYGLYSSITEGPILWNMSKEDYIQFRLEEERREIELRAYEIFEENRWVYEFDELTKNVISNMSKEEFALFLKDCGSDLTVDDFEFREDIEEDDDYWIGEDEY